MPYISPVHTSLSYLTDEELFAQIDKIRHYSPLIQELCIRLEELGLNMPNFTNTETKSFINNCPVCESGLLFNYNNDEEIFTINPYIG